MEHISGIIKQLNLADCKKHIRFFAVSLLISIISFIVLISNSLTNTFDGLWCGSYYREYHWVISIGRYVWPVTGFIRNHLSPEPFTSIMTLSIYTLGACLVISVFGLWGKWQTYLIAAGLSINTAVCVALSYRYMSPVFATAFFLAILAFWALIRIEKIPGIVITALLIAGCLGCYQANLGCFCTLGAVFLLYLLIKGEDLSEILKTALRAFLSLILGCIVYKIVWDLGMKVRHAEAAEYLGADSVSLKSIFLMLPQGIREAYTSSFSYFSGKSIYFNAFQKTPVYSAFFIVFLVILLLSLILILKKDILRLILCLLLIAVIPVCANISLLLAPSAGGVSVQMTHPLLTALFLLFCVLFSSGSEDGPGVGKILLISASVLCIFFIYGSFLQTSVDQEVMLSSRNTTIQFMNRVFSDLERRNAEIDFSAPVIFAGRPSDNPLFRKGFKMYSKQDESGSGRARGSLWNIANPYTHYGEFWLGGNCGDMSYKGLVRDCGILLEPLNNTDIWNRIVESEDVAAMPAYPAEGYVTSIDGYTVIKLS